MITNLLSAIPFIGNDLVPLKKKWILPSYLILLIYLFQNPNILKNIKIIKILKNLKNLKIIKILKNLKNIKKGWLFIFNKYFNLNKIINYFTIKNKNNMNSSGEVYHDVANHNIYKNYICDRRLLALIVGFIDGDGYFRVTKKTKKSTNINYIVISLVINLNCNETDLLKYFVYKLGIGHIYNITPKKGKKIVRLEISKSWPCPPLLCRGGVNQN